jgi:hypothetical protein
MKEQSEMHPQAATLPLQQPRIYSASLPLREIFASSRRSVCPPRPSLPSDTGYSLKKALSIKKWKKKSEVFNDHPAEPPHRGFIRAG